jgi:CHAT domain-containing protein/tetratricopeptide (TPR) repeat protein
LPEPPTVVRLFLALRERLEYYERTGDATALREHEACAQAEALRPYGVFLAPEHGWPPLVIDWDVTHLLATWHHARSEPDQALLLFSLVNLAAPDAVPEPLRDQVRSLPPPSMADLTSVFDQSREAFARWEATGDAEALEIMIRLSSWGAAGTPDDHPDKPMLLSNLCAALRGRFSVMNDPADLEGAVAVGRRSLELAADDHPALGLLLNNHGYALYGRFGLTRSPEDLDAAVELARRAVAATPAGDPLRATCQFNAATTLLLRYESHDDLANLAEGIETFHEAAKAMPKSAGPQRANVLANLALALRERFERLGDPADLDAATSHATAALAACPPAHPRTAYCLNVLAQVRTARFQHGADLADADAAVDAARRAVAATKEGDATRPDRLNTLGLILRRRGENRHEPSDLTEAARVHEDALRATPPGSPDHAMYQVNLGIARSALFEHTGLLSDLDAAIDAGRRGLGDTRAGDPKRFVAMVAFATTLRARAEHTGAAADFDEAIAMLRQARESVPEGHPAVLKCLSELGNAYTSRFQHTADLTDLDNGIAATEQAIDLAGEHDRQRMIDVANLAGAYHLRFGRTEDLTDLRTAVDRGREAVRITPEGHENRASAEFHLGRIMQARYERTGSLADLDEAVRHLEHAERRARSRPVQHAMLLSNLGAALRHRYERLDGQADGDRAIELSRQAVEIVPAGHPDRAIYLSNLTTALAARCTRTGAPQDIEAAVVASREAVRLTAAEGMNLAINLTNLALALRRRYEQTFALSDLDEAIQANRSAVEAAPADHPLRPQILSNLSVTLMSRFIRTEDPAAVDEMIEAAHAAVETVSADHAARPRYLANYANALHLRHAVTNDPADAEAGVAAIDEALRLIPQDHPNRMLYLGNLAVALEDRYAHSQSPDDLDAVIEEGRAAVLATPAGHPGGARCRYNLGRALVSRARRTGSRADWGTAVDLFREVVRTETVPTSLRVQAARAWGHASGGMRDWAQAVDGYRAAVELLPLLAWHGLERGDRVSALGAFAGLASEAAAAALTHNDPEQALRLLEHGRGVLLAQALDTRGDLSGLVAVDPDLAERMRAVRAELDSPTPIVAGDGADDLDQRGLADRRRELAREWDILLARARTLPGQADFLRPPSLERLRAAADGGPVVVLNVHRSRCDALILTDAGLSTVRLRRLTAKEVAERTATLLEALADTGSVAGAWRAQRVLRQVLAWLWDTVAKPVLAALPADSARLWWCPTGMLAFLPVHAAGHHDSGSRHTLLDRVTCSYTPTVRALAEARARTPAPARMLAVGQPASPGLSPLPNALTEVRGLASRVPGTTLLTDDAATRAAVLAALPDHSYLHFAGHGSQNPLDAAGGGLYCADHQQAGPITVADVTRLRLDRAELVFLSACETARGQLAVPDEAVHLAGALQLAGFTHVVATQWIVSDTHAADIADHFYANLAEGPAPLVSSRAATALHAAVRELRDRHADPLLWASYVHSGP